MEIGKSSSARSNCAKYWRASSHFHTFTSLFNALKMAYTLPFNDGTGLEIEKSDLPTCRDHYQSCHISYKNHVGHH